MINNCDNNCLLCDNSKIIDDNFQYNYFKHSTPISATLCLTHNCNLSCPYCFVKQKPERMSLETAKKAVEWIRRNYALKHLYQQENRDMTIYFFGGEPLLEFDTVIAPLLEEYGDIPHLHFSITTNGTLLTEKILQYFKKYNVSVMLSFDGIEKVQNIQRPGKNCNSYNTVINIIPELLSYIPNAVMRSTFTKSSIQYIYDTILLADRLGFQEISIHPNYFENQIDLQDQLFTQLNQCNQYIQQRLLNDQTPIRIRNLHRYFKYFTHNKKSIFPRTIFKCGLGTSFCGITPSGDIIYCHDKSSYSPSSLGNVYTGGIDKKIHKQFLEDAIQQINSIKCYGDDSDCQIYDFCMRTMCWIKTEEFDGHIVPSECMLNKIIAQIVIEDTYDFYLKHKSNVFIEQYFNPTSKYL